MPRELPQYHPSAYGLEAKLPPVFDHQVSGTFAECERMAYYRHILGRNPRGDQYALTWGSAFHAATEMWHETKNIEAVIEVINQSVAEVTEDKYGRNRARMYELMLEWIKFEKANPLKILRTEQSIQVGCYGDNDCPYYDTGCGLEYGGRMDRIVEWDGMIGPLDYKTTVMDDTDPVSEYKPNHQMMGYVWAASHLMGKHAWGIIVERVVCNKSKIKVTRFPVSYSRDLIREWVENEKIIQARLRQLFENHPDNEIAWRQNHFRCWKPYPCSFRDACLSPRDMGFRYKWLRDNTDERRWDFHNIQQENSNGQE